MMAPAAAPIAPPTTAPVPVRSPWLPMTAPMTAPVAPPTAAPFLEVLLQPAPITSAARMHRQRRAERDSNRMGPDLLRAASYAALRLLCPAAAPGAASTPVAGGSASW